MNVSLIYAAEKTAEKAAEEPSPFLTLLSHLVPHQYSWSPAIHLGPFDLTITNAVVNIWLAAIAVIVLFWAAASKPKLVPSGLQNTIEMATDFVKRDIVYGIMSPKDAKVWFPFIGTIFFFVLFMNAFGLIPYIGFTPTSNIWVALALSLGVYLLAIGIGMARHGVLTFWKKSIVPPRCA